MLARAPRYVDRIAHEGEWGGNSTLAAAANAFGRTIQLVCAPTDAPSSLTVIAPDYRRHRGGADIWLAYLDGVHYRATVPLETPTRAQARAGGFANEHDLCPFIVPEPGASAVGLGKWISPKGPASGRARGKVRHSAP